MQHSTFDYNAHCEKIISEWNGRQESIHTATCCIVWKTNDVGGKKRKNDEKWCMELWKTQLAPTAVRETERNIANWNVNLSSHSRYLSYSRCDATIKLVWECNQKTSYCKFWQMSDRNMIKHSRGSIHGFLAVVFLVSQWLINLACWLATCWAIVVNLFSYSTVVCSVLCLAPHQCQIFALEKLEIINHLNHHSILRISERSSDILS